MASFPRQIKHIRSGESVTAGNAGRPDRALDDRTQYLKDRFDASETGGSLVLYDRTVKSDCLVGQPVYWNDENQRFEKAIAEVEEVAGVLTLADSAVVLGIVHAKSSSTLADILFAGAAKLSLSNSVTGTVTAGLYYLSSSQAGKLTKQKPGVSVPVLYADGQGNIYRVPALRDFIDSHVHYTFELRAHPSGFHQAPVQGERHFITDADVDIKGWLPADHESFDGLAPSNAAFGYNMAAHPELQRVWPPIPLSAVSIVWDKGEDRLGGTAVPLGSTGLVVVDSNGIWWMSDCYNDVPWGTSLDTRQADSSSSSLGTPECIRNERMKITISFARMSYLTDRSVVTKLTSPSGSVISVKNADDEDAETGDLVLNARITTSDLPALITYVEGTLQEMVSDFPQLTMRESIPAKIRGRIDIPSDGIPDDPTLRVRLKLRGTAVGTLPALPLVYRIMSRSTDEALPLPVSDTTLSINTQLAIPVAGYYVEAQSNKLAVEAGDIVMFMVSRPATDSYDGDVGVLDICGVLESAD